MKLLGRNRLNQLISESSATKVWVNAWSSEIDSCSWKSVDDVKDRFPSVVCIENCMFTFKVDGCDMSIETIMDFNALTVLIIAVKVT
ncbi:type II toxin-antitoxin system HigB family toxin [Escherichia coli]|jgi:mRNA-degrading endonuclease HigB of HigAB toxin-antitoxin module|uniref:type II toxin-antitoxin system HigB family toxin n=1 Tax=Enterobacteriaceae TaxID=543 RepID=UPI00071B1298|nr:MULTISPECIES: type II toxin-antitoxin system HigB family toxin [Enterobacteriaceae]EFN8413108.1 hypothetical protein [Escherichia coli O7]ALQ58815.1 hypothetical protein AB850_09920 [Escherichia coli]EEV8827060.1 type II toxin-antitoxin system HigB family toxin [Escherichia coli]EFC4349988.1 type II toxin-antitoxin system HigB family toxin [Escherichia coli]EFE7542276.1 type II toxin-antitoxin system HigB family toxin [Escherichia coli]